MKSLTNRSLITALLALGAVIALPLVAAANPLPGDMYLSLSDPVPVPDPIPGNCSWWHGLWPVFCMNLHQDDYLDQPNEPGTGQVSACDYIQLDMDDAGTPQWYHIEWAGPTYYLSGVPYEPVGEPGPDVVCQMWQEIPDDGRPFEEWPDPLHVDDWHDADGSLDVSPCDIIVLGGVTWHVTDVTLNIVVVPGDPVATEQKSWGETKVLYDE